MKRKDGESGADTGTMAKTEDSGQRRGADSGCQPFTTFGATCRDDFAAIFSGHAGTETVVTLTLDVARLECPFHGVIPK